MWPTYNLALPVDERPVGGVVQVVVESADEGGALCCRCRMLPISLAEVHNLRPARGELTSGAAQTVSSHGLFKSMQMMRMEIIGERFTQCLVNRGEARGDGGRSPPVSLASPSVSLRSEKTEKGPPLSFFRFAPPKSRFAPPPPRPPSSAFAPAC